MRPAGKETKYVETPETSIAPSQQCEIAITRVAGGKIVEDWGLDDRLGMLQQLGLLPAM